MNPIVVGKGPSCIYIYIHFIYTVYIYIDIYVPIYICNHVEMYIYGFRLSISTRRISSSRAQFCDFHGQLFSGERNMALRLHLSCDCSLMPASCPRGVPIFVAIFEDQPMVSTRKNQPQNGLLKPLNQGRGRSNTMIFDVTLPDNERKHIYKPLC